MAGDPNIVLLANPGADLYGSDRMAVESVKALVRSGRRVIVTVPGPGPLVDMLTEAGASVREQPTPIIRRSLASPRGMLQLARDVLSTLRPCVRLLRSTNAGTVLVNTITPVLWFPLARLTGRHLVAHVHEAEGTASKRMRRALYLPLGLCHRVVLNSQFCMEVVTSSAPRLRGRSCVVHNAVAGPARVTAPRAEVVGAVQLLYVGRLSHRKGPHVAVEAVRLLKERGVAVHLSLLGAVFPGNEEYEDRLRASVRSWGLEADVTFLGFHPSVWPSLARADVVVVPSILDESFGNTAAEASLAGRPVIVSDIAGLREASQAATSRILVPPSDPAAIADAVDRMLGDWGRFASGARRDAVAVAERFSFDQYADGLLDGMALPEADRTAG
jgi:glycosyltransferase involved in cell wall biosynthesis